MFAARIKPQVYSTTFISCRNLSIRNFASRLKQCCSNANDEILCKHARLNLKRIRNLFRPVDFLIHQPFEFSKNSLKFYRKYCHNFTTKKLVGTVFKRFPPGRPLCTTFAAAACTFSWEDNNISDKEIQSHVDELRLFGKQSKTNSVLPPQSEYKNLPDQWQNILDEPNIKIWKLPYKKTGIMQYKVLGRFLDISARQFFAVQTNLNYRRKWDELVISISVVDENKQTDQQVLRWITHFPYPFKSREYVYIRRAKILEEQNVLVLISRSVNHPKCEIGKKHVRVPLYISDMVIKPHEDFDQPGMDYLLTYCDNPQTSIPTQVSSWVVTKGIPDYINKLHDAAKEIREIKDTDDCGGTASTTKSDKSSGSFEINLKSYTSNTVKAF